jgi:hypothetical protein
MAVQPNVPFEVLYETDRPKNYMIGVVMIFSVILLLLFAFDIMVVRRQRKLMATARKTHALVASLFPENVQERILGDAPGATPKASTFKRAKSVGSASVDDPSCSQGTAGSSNGGGAFVYGSKPIADFFPSTTIMFADLAGFTAWSSKREPTHVFQLLEKIYGSFDEAARARGVFKVCYTESEKENDKSYS